MITISINSVDEKDSWQMNSDDPDKILFFLETYYHESSNIRLDLQMWNEDALRILKLLSENK